MTKKKVHKPRPHATSSTAAQTKRSAEAAASLEDINASKVADQAGPTDQGSSYAAKAAVPPSSANEAVVDKDTVTEDVVNDQIKVSSSSAKNEGVPDRWDVTDSENDFTSAAGSPVPSIRNARLAASPRKKAFFKEPGPSSSRPIVPQRQRSPGNMPPPGKPYSTLQAERPVRASSSSTFEKRRSGDEQALSDFDFDAHQRAAAGAAAKRPRREVISDGDTVETVQLGRPPASTQPEDDDVTLVHDGGSLLTLTPGPRPKTMVEKHVAFFDRKGTGIITCTDTWNGFRELGFNLFLSALAVFIIHSGFSWPSQGYGLPDPRFRCHVAGMPKCKHGSDSGTYDTDGEMVKAKFEALWRRHAPDGQSMDKWDMYAMTVRHRLLFDPFGWLAQVFEWFSTYLLLADEQGRVHKRDVEGVFTGDIFYTIAAERAKDRKGGPVKA